jgi:hypothetical protein
MHLGIPGLVGLARSMPHEQDFHSLGLAILDDVNGR